MVQLTVIPLLAFYGCFLIGCGIASVLVIGPKAKTALISGGISGSVSLVLSYQVSTGCDWAHGAGIVLSLALFGVFTWRCTKTLYRIFDLLSNQFSSEELRKKGTAFLIISLMAVVSMLVFVLLCISWKVGDS